MKRYLFFLSTTALLLGTSCDKVLEVEDADAVDLNNHYNTFVDADNAILGIYGKVFKLVDRLVVLGELRADLMDITPNATFDLAAISSHSATADNKYCDMTPFYEVILNCNDVLLNFNRMKANNQLSETDYPYRYSDVMTVRCWVYLQLIIHFGSIPYITDPLLTTDDLADLSKFPKKTFDEVLNILIYEMLSIPSLKVSTSSPIYTVSYFSVNGVTYPSRYLFLNKLFVLGDLALWANQYELAATSYHALITEAEVSLAENRAYKLDTWVWSGSNEPRFQVCYARYKADDLNSFRNKWKEMFSYQPSTSELAYEQITMWYYGTDYPLIELFANTGLGKYMLKPSAYAIDSLWEAQIQRENSFVFDGRGRESSFDHVNGQPVVLKYLYDYYDGATANRDANSTLHLDYSTLAKPYVLRGKWFIQRAAMLHLHYAEAANRAGYPLLALALLNSGVSSQFSWPLSTGDERADGSGVNYSGWKPANDTSPSTPYPAPWYLDARNDDAPEYFRSPWRENAGLRGRAFVQPVVLPSCTAADTVRYIEEALLTEQALELGFEGHRWGEMLRIAMRKNMANGTGTAYLNSLMRKAKPGLPELTPETWFLPGK